MWSPPIQEQIVDPQRSPPSLCSRTVEQMESLAAEEGASAEWRSWFQNNAAEKHSSSSSLIQRQNVSECNERVKWDGWGNEEQEPILYEKKCKRTKPSRLWSHIPQRFFSTSSVFLWNIRHMSVLNIIIIQCPHCDSSTFSYVCRLPLISCLTHRSNLLILRLSREKQNPALQTKRLEESTNSLCASKSNRVQRCWKQTSAESSMFYVLAGVHLNVKPLYVDPGRWRKIRGKAHLLVLKV